MKHSKAAITTPNSMTSDSAHQAPLSKILEDITLLDVTIPRFIAPDIPQYTHYRPQSQEQHTPQTQTLQSPDNWLHPPFLLNQADTELYFFAFDIETLAQQISLLE